MGLGIKSPSMKAPAHSSAPQNTSVGGGSRPTTSRLSTPTSAPTEPYELDRATPGALGVGMGRAKPQ